MKVLVVVVVCLAASACARSSDESGAIEVPTPIATVAVEPLPTATVPPTAVSIVVVSDDELTAAAVTQLDADISAGQGPEGMIAYDLLDSTVSDAGDVTLTVCAWDGESAFDQVRDSLLRTTVDDGGSVSAQHVDSPIAQGDCLNTTLIETALDIANKYDAYWSEMVANPELFADDERKDRLLLDQFVEQSAEVIESALERDVHFPHGRVAGPLEETTVEDILFRRYRVRELEILEFAFCRNMNPLRGTYRDDVLIDDGRLDDDPSLHSIDSVELVLSETAVGRWVVGGRQALVWADCNGTGDWPAAASAWQPRDVDFEALPE